MKSPSRAGALARTASTGSDGRDDVLAQDVLELDGLRGRRDVVGRQLGQDRVLVEDVVELGLEAGQLGVGQPEAGEVGDVLDIRAGQGGHAPDDSRRVRYDRPVQLPIIRPMTPADVDPIVAAFLREDWGDRRLNLEFVTSHPETHPFVADADGTVVGTGVVSVNGPVAWIGTIWVDPAWRRRGVGLELTRGDDRRRRGGRLPDARPRRDRGRPAAVRAARVRGPDLVPDPRGARARRQRADRSARSVRSSRPTWRR